MSVSINGSGSITGVSTLTSEVEVPNISVGTGGTVITTTDDGNVGIQTSNPLTKLDISCPQFDPAGQLNTTTNSSQNTGINLNYHGGDASGDAGAGIKFAQRWWSAGEPQTLISTAAIYGYKRGPTGTFGGGIKIATSNGNSNSLADRLIIDDSGRVAMPYQPAFYAYRADNANQVASGDQVFNGTKTNRGGHYSTSNGRFTAPVAGAYFFSCSIQLYGAPTTGHALSFRINGTDFHGSQSSSNPVYDEPAGNHHMLYFSAVISLAANEYVTVWTDKTVRGMQSYFTGYFIG